MTTNRKIYKLLSINAVMEDLESEIKEVAREYSKRIIEKPKLGDNLGNSYLFPDFVNKKNRFEIEVDLIKQMRKAYENCDENSFDKIPLYIQGVGVGSNSITYSSKNEVSPFSNETTARHTYWIKNFFKEVDSFGKSTNLYANLQTKVKEIEQERNTLQDQIVSTPNYQSALEAEGPNLNWSERKESRLAYRNEEFERMDAIIKLCNDFEDIYSVSGKLLRELELNLREKFLKEK